MSLVQDVLEGNEYKIGVPQKTANALFTELHKKRHDVSREEWTKQADRALRFITKHAKDDVFIAAGRLALLELKLPLDPQTVAFQDFSKRYSAILIPSANVAA